MMDHFSILLLLSACLFAVGVASYLVDLLKAPTWPTVETLRLERARLEHELRRAILLGMPERELLAMEERIYMIEDMIRSCLAQRYS